MNLKYRVLLNILKKICEDAPPAFKFFKPPPRDQKKVDAARSRAYIHLYLKANFGITDFAEAERYVTDGAGDGGVDAYYIDKKAKKIYFIQSKFKTVEEKFETTEIDANELAQMEVGRILRGEDTDEQGTSYNGKIKGLQQALIALSDYKKYDKEIIIFANLKRLSERATKRLVGGYSHTIFDYEKTYEKLIFPVCSGTYYDPDEIKIRINLKGKKHPDVNQLIETTLGPCQVMVLFVPTIEVAKILQQYKNAILKFNPRNFLSLGKNEINKKIKNSLIARTTNDFALLNNGITILAEDADYVDDYGRKNEGALILTTPQIINGAQTAHTLARILGSEKEEVFENKEVLLRVVVVDRENPKSAQFIEELSDATNQQTPIKEADRRSNDPIQVKIQEQLFKRYGHFYARKRGEFESGLSEGYVGKKLVIEREELVKAYVALCGRASEARRTSVALFREKYFGDFFKNNLYYDKMFFAYRCYVVLNKNKKLKNEVKKRNLKYSRMAIIAAVGRNVPVLPPNLIAVAEIDKLAEGALFGVLKEWPAFEKSIESSKANRKTYMEGEVMDYDNYYKGNTVDSDIEEFFQRP